MSGSATGGPERLGRMAAGAAIVVMLVIGGAGPAGAEPQRTMSIDPAGEPAGDITASPVLNGSFKSSTTVLTGEKITAVDLKVSPTGPTGGSPVTQDGCAVASDGACNTRLIAYSWKIPALAFNGPYVVEATARYCDPLLCLSPASTSATPIQFRLGLDPRPPTDLRAEPGENRSVALSWARNTEPDLLHYALFRKDPGGEFRRLGNDIKQPASGRPTFSDSSVTDTSGGDFVYRVFAVRKGLSGDEKTTRISGASADRSATVAPPPTTIPVTVADGAPTTLPAGEGVDIGSFLSGQAPTLPTPAPIFLDLPDTGFGELLPFGALPDEAEPGEEEAVLPTTPRQREVAQFNRNRPLIPVAAGAVLLVLAGHIRLLNLRIKPAVAPKKLPPGAYVARALNEARSAQVPTDVPIDVAMATAVANGGRHRAPPADDLAGLPVWAEFEPVSAMGLFDEYDQGDVYADHNRANGSGASDHRPFDVAATQQPEPKPEPEPEPAPEPEQHNDLDGDSQWAAEPEVFVSPRS